MSTLQNKNTQIEFIAGKNEFSLIYQQRLILRHTAQAPCLWIGGGEADIDMFRGNFSIKDRLNERSP